MNFCRRIGSADAIPQLGGKSPAAASLWNGSSAHGASIFRL
jgi:hypothetical protein